MKPQVLNTPESPADGFTLIELMSVLAIIGILAAIAYPSYQESIRKAKRSEGRTALMRLMQQEEKYFSQHAQYQEFSWSVPNGFQWWSGNAAPDSAYEITATACSGDVIQNCVLLSAVPGTVQVDGHFQDSACGTLTLTSTGIKAATGTATNCW